HLLHASPDGFYALATIGEALRCEGFDTRAYSGRGVKQMLAEVYPESADTAAYDGSHNKHHYVYLPALEPHGVPAPAVNRTYMPAEPDPDTDIVDLRRRFEFILTSSVPAPDGWYELVKITPALKARDFDFRQYGFPRLIDLLRALYGRFLDIEDRGDAEHPNKKFLHLPDDDCLHMLPTSLADQAERRAPRLTERSASRILPEGHIKTALEKLLDFAFFPAPAGRNGLDIAIGYLAATARHERWYYGRHDPGTNPLLKNFLTLTFERLQYEDSVGKDDPRYEPKILVEGRFATFNTGLCDPYNEPIYALFKQNERTSDARPWTFMAFVGSRAMGQYDMTGKFGARLPQPAHYYNST
ncbi:MAG: DUF3825 domain-containing protein, partial [Muribaculaceae bacterium]|nr:DUF3825 domain-containing protein [Muribaculaceae bacterium]